MLETSRFAVNKRSNLIDCFSFSTTIQSGVVFWTRHFNCANPYQLFARLLLHWQYNFNGCVEHVLQISLRYVVNNRSSSSSPQEIWRLLLYYTVDGVIPEQIKSELNFLGEKKLWKTFPEQLLFGQPNKHRLLTWDLELPKVLSKANCCRVHNVIVYSNNDLKNLPTISFGSLGWVEVFSSLLLVN